MKRKIKLFLGSKVICIRKSVFCKNEFAEKQIIFIHVPKVAGTALKKSLGFSDIYHIHLADYELDDKDKFNKYFKIAFVRNPWDRLVSAFFFLKQGGDKSSHDLILKDRLDQFNTFRNFVFELNNNIKFRLEIKKVIVFSNQYSWLANSKGEIDMDYVGRFENLEEGFNILKEKLHKKDAQLKKYNSSKHKPYWEYYDEETVEIVRKIYSKDIETFNYEFPYEKLKSRN